MQAEMWVAMFVLDRSLSLEPIKISAYVLCQFPSILEVSILDK